MRRGFFLTGLFLTTLASLCLEVLDTRLLSVVTWYHLSFFVISMAMFGTSAGALSVYFLGAAPEDPAADRRLERGALLLALAIPVFHGVILIVPLPLDAPALTPLALALTTLAVALPFYLSGAVVANALVRLPGRVGLTYGVDLLGAALGSLLAVPVLALSNVAAGVLLCGALAAAAAACFRLHAGGRRPWAALTIALVLLVAAASTNRSGDRSTVFYPKGRYWSPKQISREIWSIQSQVLLGRPRWGPPQYWGPGQAAVTGAVESQQILIDGAASTTLTAWNGDVANIAWVQHDVTSIPYHLRRGGDVAIVGAGGGRDILTALWAGSRSVEGIEVNGAVSRLLKRDRRDYAGIADRPEVVLVHDEARSYLTRTPRRYDVPRCPLSIAGQRRPPGGSPSPRTHCTRSRPGGSSWPTSSRQAC
jgi:hypothetical protein